MSAQISADRRTAVVRIQQRSCHGQDHVSNRHDRSICSAGQLRRDYGTKGIISLTLLNHGSKLNDWSFVNEIKTFVFQRSRVLREANGGFDTMETARYRDVTYDEVLRRSPRIEIGLGLSQVELLFLTCTLPSLHFTSD